MGRPAVASYLSVDQDVETMPQASRLRVRWLWFDRCDS